MNKTIKIMTKTITHFNRQTGFNSIELAFLSNTIRTFQDAKFLDEFINKLHGLYDGYYYHDLLELCDKFIEDNKATAKVNDMLVALYRAKSDLKLIIDKVKTLPEISESEAHQLI